VPFRRVHSSASAAAISSAIAEAADHPDVTADRVSPRLFRHTVGFRLAAKGVTPTQIGDSLGKNSPAVVYVETEAETVENMANELLGE
jgi:integrase